MTISTLEDFRAKIDAIDDRIIDLLKKRMAIVKNVADFKNKNHYKFFIRSAREADMIKNLQKKCDFSFPKSAIFDIWRKIITSSNVVEQELKIAICNPKNIPDYLYQTQKYYGDFITIDSHKTAKDIITKLTKNQIQIAIFALEINQDWWSLLSKSEAKIFALIPPIKKTSKTKSITHNQNHLLLIAIKDQEKSTSDNSLLTIKLNKTTSQNKILSILKKANLQPKILDQKDHVSYLIEIKGFYTDHCQEIIALKNDFDRNTTIKIIGNYPVT